MEHKSIAVYERLIAQTTEAHLRGELEHILKQKREHVETLGRWLVMYKYHEQQR